MLRSGTTCFLEAGTIYHLDEVFSELSKVGIRGRLGKWIWDLPPEPVIYRQSTDVAIENLNLFLNLFLFVTKVGGSASALPFLSSSAFGSRFDS